MDEKEIMKGNIKLTVFDSFPYEELKKVCDAIVELGYECEFQDGGPIVFQKKEKEEKTGQSTPPRKRRGKK